MVQVLEPEKVDVEVEKMIALPEIDIEYKENLPQYFRLMLAGNPLLKFSITNEKGKELYSNLLNVEMR
ncbi:MAG: hypothetical protein EAX91_15705 [Candidatus Lokiarchaeota archaeon]|nr:hypothetical protein [Candidatus Lokiarchaeota archaeon]